jgi:hypothetical protein
MRNASFKESLSLVNPKSNLVRNTGCLAVRGNWMPLEEFAESQSSAD